VLAGCRCNERVVDRTTGDPEPGELADERRRYRLAEEDRRREIVTQDADGVGRRSSQRPGESGQDRVRLEPGVAGEAEPAASDRLERGRMAS
jgi:hypothetical protein